MEYVFGIIGVVSLMYGFCDGLAAVYTRGKMHWSVFFMVVGLLGLAISLPLVALGGAMFLSGSLLAYASKSRGRMAVFWVTMAVVGLVIVLGAIDRSPSELHQHTRKGATQRVAPLFYRLCFFICYTRGRFLRVVPFCYLL